ncbi:hypothetical protein [Natronosalvus halobius]|uniref:hypothetical protein n=1 Tax=Natronosalvus halobius TaxID=2953746 RepID=UPI0020A0DFFC|nr:hypothetical protein [Natronosalvus halobius]USZ70312.1 hypothetical protein NGM15_09270 [Natronosalvus halobius]
MHRRTMIAALGTAVTIAGCLDESPAGSSDGDTDDSTENGTDTGDENETDPSSGSDTDRNSRTIDAKSVATAFDGQVERPECTKESETVELERGDETREYETAATIPYPGPPKSFDDDAIFEYVADFEEAYITHDVLCDSNSGYIFDVATSVREQHLLGWDEEITVMFCQRAAGATHGADEDGGEWQADIGYSGVAYAVDETGAARVRAETHDVETYEADGSSPLEEGDLVAVFE